MILGARCYELYGLLIRSEVSLPGVEVVSDGSPDMAVSWGQRRPIPIAVPEGNLLARSCWPNGQGYSLVESNAGYTLRVHSICDFDISTDRHSISVHLDDEADAEMAPVFLAGLVLSIVLGLAGECILHASAVELEGVAVACLGGAGAGKSTLAALLCEAGAELVTDDVLRVDFSNGTVRCFPGSVEARLRVGAAELAQRFGSNDRKPTADGRLAIRLRNGRTSRPELRAIVIPRPSRETAELRIAKCTPQEALLELLRHPRIGGWKVEKPLRNQFRGFVQLARTVPIFSADVPWEPPFPGDLGDRLLRSLGLRA